MVDNMYIGERISGHSPFWLDTLCIPISLDLKKIGIRRMREVYECSDKVLVIDKDLQEFGESNGLEPLIRINMSKWARRLWKLHEGSLSKTLFFDSDREDC